MYVSDGLGGAPITWVSPLTTVLRKNRASYANVVSFADAMADMSKSLGITFVHDLLKDAAGGLRSAFRGDADATARSAFSYATKASGGVSLIYGAVGTVYGLTTAEPTGSAVFSTLSGLFGSLVPVFDPLSKGEPPSPGALIGVGVTLIGAGAVVGIASPALSAINTPAFAQQLANLPGLTPEQQKQANDFVEKKLEEDKERQSRDAKARARADAKAKAKAKAKEKLLAKMIADRAKLLETPDDEKSPSEGKPSSTAKSGVSTPAIVGGAVGAGLLIYLLSRK